MHNAILHRFERIRASLSLILSQGKNIRLLHHFPITLQCDPVATNLHVINNVKMKELIKKEFKTTAKVYSQFVSVLLRLPVIVLYRVAQVFYYKMEDPS